MGSDRNCILMYRDDSGVWLPFAGFGFVIVVNLHKKAFLVAAGGAHCALAIAAAGRTHGCIGHINQLAKAIVKFKAITHDRKEVENG